MISKYPSQKFQSYLKPQKSTSGEDLRLVNFNSQLEHIAVPEIDKPNRYHGHHFGVRCCFCLVAVVFLINIILIVVATSKNQSLVGTALLWQGNCKGLDIWIHLLVNILSTALLGASNYCIQCVTAPTRCDIDKAHRQYKWMDIGIPSVRNVRRIPWPRKILWFLLCVSSVPLHLIYNSVMFSCVSVRDDTICSVRLSVPFMIAILIFNIVKLLCMATIIWGIKFTPLVTLGDALAAFLDNPGMLSIALSYHSAQLLYNNMTKTKSPGHTF